jgi:MoaA/NifB/PqqE/SkfB family radical SAM enzyme
VRAVRIAVILPAVANIGYIQVVRHCNHFCGFCSNPTTPYSHTFESMKVLVDDFVERGYFGVILTGGEPSLHPELPRICQYASEAGLHVRMITNGTRLADKKFAQAMAEAGLKIVHVSIYSVIEAVEDSLRGTPGTLPIALQALDNAEEFGIEVNINCVINKLNADHLDLNIKYFLEHHPYIRHYVWNNLDPSMGRAEVNQDQFTPRLADFELSLHRACRLLQRSGRSFRVEKVPLCYMTDFAWASTETRKIVKSEERIVHFLDDKQTVRQREWGHKYAPVCEQCSLRSICGGVFDRGDAYDPAELYPVFVSRDAIVEQILGDPKDPSFGTLTLEQWKQRFDGPPAPSNNDSDIPPEAMREGGLQVGAVTEKSRKLFEAKRRAESKKAERSGVSLESTKIIERALDSSES